MPKVYMMIGIQGSGKSTYSKELSLKLNIPIVSTDRIRLDNPTMPEEEVWTNVYSMCANYLKSGSDIVFDATNITPNVRNRFKDNLAKYDVKYDLIGIYLNTDIEICYKRVVDRNERKMEHYLPPEVVYNYASNFIPPSKEEGFIEIIEIKNYHK